jgi:site-specific recombinase
MSLNPTSARLSWPAILHFDGQPELAYIGSLAEWQAAVDLQHHVYHAKDRLIDAEGTVYHLTQRAQNRVLPQATGQHLALDEVVELVRMHLAREGRACIAKFYAPSIAAAMAMANDDEQYTR